jgi:hypothetical protein
MPAAGDRAIVCIPKWPNQAIDDGTPRHPAPAIALTIEVGELRQLINTRSSNSPLNFLPRVVWMLRRHAVPWWQLQNVGRVRQSDDVEGRISMNQGPDPLTPDAKAIWRWAMGRESQGERDPPVEGKAHEFFCGVSASGTRDDAA